MNQLIAGAAAIALVLGGWLLFTKSASSTTAPINVGVLTALTGDAAPYGEAERNIGLLAADEINANGGIGGKPLNLIFEDSKCDAQSAVTATQKLITVDHVQVIIGGFCSSESLAIVPIAAQAKVALLSLSSSPALTGISPFFARDFPSDSSQGVELAQAAYASQGWRKVAFIQEQSDYPLGIYTSFSETFTKLGGTVSHESFSTGAIDFRSILTKIKSERPDAVFVDTQTPSAADRILTQMTQLNYRPHILLTDTTIADPETVSAHTALLEGALGAVFGVESANKKFSDLVTHYKEKYATDLPYPSYGQAEYDAVYLVADAIKAVGYDGTRIAQWLHTYVKGWQGASGLITIGRDGDRVGGHTVEVIRGGKVEPYITR